MKRIALLSIFLVIALSCTDTDQRLTGTWEIEEMKIRMNSFQNSQSDTVIEVTSDSWEEKMKTRNIQTTFNADGTYHSLHRNLKDSVVYDPAGIWSIRGDSLVIQDTIPVNVTYKYKVLIGDGVAEFWGTEDFDQDGKVDDEYYSRQRRISK